MEVKISRHSSVASKFTKFLMSFFKVQVSSSSNFASFFNVITHNSCVPFYVKYNTISTKVKFSDLLLLTLDFTKFLMSFSEPRVSFSSTLNHCSVSWNITLLYKTLYTLDKNEPMKVQIFRLSTSHIKINQNLYVICQATSLVSLKFCVTRQYQDAQFLWNFLAETLYTIIYFGQKQPIKVQFFILLSALSFWVLFQFLMPFLKPQGQGLFKFCITFQCHER